MIKPKILSKLPFKSASTQAAPILPGQPTVAQKAKIAPVKAKLSLNSAKTRLANGRKKFSCELLMY